MGDWEKAVDLICDYLEEEDQTEEEFFTGGVSDDKVKQAEIALDIELPKTYVSFLKRFGSGGIGCADFFGIENKTDESENFTVVKITQMYREKVNLPKYLVVIENFGDYIVCLNTSEKHGDDCCVVSYGLYDGDNILQCSDSFYGYMLEKLDDALN